MSSGSLLLSENLNVGIFSKPSWHVFTFDVVDVRILLVKNTILDAFEHLKLLFNFWVIFELVHPVLDEEFGIPFILVDLSFNFINLSVELGNHVLEKIICKLITFLKV